MKYMVRKNLKITPPRPEYLRYFRILFLSPFLWKITIHLGGRLRVSSYKAVSQLGLLMSYHWSVAELVSGPPNHLCAPSVATYGDSHPQSPMLHSLINSTNGLALWAEANKGEKHQLTKNRSSV